jgi:hypothetical protein
MFMDFLSAEKRLQWVVAEWMLSDMVRDVFW